MIIFLDLDGVIINWVKGVFDWFHIKYEPEKVTHWDIMPELLNLKKEDFWTLIKTPKFWENLEFYPDAKEFITQLEKLKIGPVVLLSSPAHGCAGYRQNWIQKNLPDFFKDGRYILTPAKWACANKNTILIDDSDKNCKSFRKHGGLAITYPQPWNEMNDIKLLNQKDKRDKVFLALITSYTRIIYKDTVLIRKDKLDSVYNFNRN